jgi:DNA replication protein DnaC
MDKKLSKALEKVQSDTQTASSKSISSGIEPAPLLGKADCPHCGGIGFLRVDVPVGHERFGKLEPCVCRAGEITKNARQRLYELSNLERLSHLTFENFNVQGNPKAKHAITQVEKDSLMEAKRACEEFAKGLSGWLLLEGTYGSGKTHLAAAIANEAVNRNTPTLFITPSDLLDRLRAGYGSSEEGFEERFEEIRNVSLLVIDDFGTQNATSWGQEKLFQLLNYRYINRLPTVITTNLILDEIESRIRSRLMDEELVRHIRLLTLDYRHPTETSNPGLSMLSMRDIREMTFHNWESREDEIGQEIVTVKFTERKGAGGYSVKDKEIQREKVTKEHINRLRAAHDASARFADNPEGWLVLLGPSHCGKTHLAAAIGHYRMGNGGQAIMTDVSVLLDYLKATFRPNADVSFDRRFYEIRTAPLLILDGFKESNMSSAWAEDKLHQLLNYRYYENLPTVITSNLDPESFAKNYPSLWFKILDANKSVVCSIDMPPYRHRAKAKKAASRKSAKG